MAALESAHLCMAADISSMDLLTFVILQQFGHSKFVVGLTLKCLQQHILYIFRYNYVHKYLDFRIL